MSARRTLLWLLAMALSGCASYGVVRNDPLGTAPAEQAYSLKNWNTGTRVNDLNVTLAFSGGGTRAAAFSYGVLKALRDTVVTIDGRPVLLLDEVDAITSVSGGSFTAAYYGLYGERIFSDFEADFLRRDVERALLDSLFNPLNWFRSSGRTERAIEYYEEHLFRGATFADLRQENRPLIVINASDLGYGVRFSFLQEYFGLLCSDLSTFPVARAVAASSAVPVVFNPVVLANHPQCGAGPPGWLDAMRRRAEGDEGKMMQVDGLATYFDRDKRRYAHLVDGGITDNLGLRALVDLVEAVGGPEAYLKAVGREAPRDQVLIVVNASTEPEPQMDASNRQPSAGETIGAMTDIQLHRYNIDTIELTRKRLREWAQALSSSSCKTFATRMSTSCTG
jgi:NTE family protein